MDSSSGRIIGIIPARYASTRFPGKPLAIINGKSMIQRVYEQASACEKLDHVVVATDDKRILDHVESFGGSAMLTSTSHNTGTDRLAEVIETLEAKGHFFEIAVNIQGDEPFIQPSQIEKVINVFNLQGVEIATLVKLITRNEDIFNPNVVKAVLDASGRALYFSRSPVPYIRNNEAANWHESGSFYKHVGIYGYKTSVLKELVKLDPSPIELAESLEQLRWLYNGYSIFAQVTDIETIGIDTPEDLQKLINISC